MSCRLTIEELKSEPNLLAKNVEFLACGSCKKPVGEHPREFDDFIHLETFSCRKKDIARVALINTTTVVIYRYGNREITVNCENEKDAWEFLQNLQRRLE